MKKILPVIFTLIALSEGNAQTMLKDVNHYANACTSCSSYPMSFVRAGNYVYFIANDSDGFELWKTDGNEAGTEMVKDINPIGNACGYSTSIWGPYATPVYAIGSQVVFFADDAIHGYEPWVSDGTEAGTHLVKDVNASSTSSLDADIEGYFQFKPPVKAGNTILFNAYSGGIGYLWVTD